MFTSKHRRVVGFALLGGVLATADTAALTPAHLWSQRFGGTSSEIGRAVAVDGLRDVLVTGSFNGTVNFGGGNLVSAGSSDIFVAKYNAAGVHQWSQRFGGTSSDDGYAVAVDGSGNVLVTGLFSGTVNFGGGDLVSAGSIDIFVAKYNAAGVHQWSQRFGGTSSDYGSAVAVDGSGNVLVTGSFDGTVSFGGGNLVSAGSIDIFVAKYNAAGVHQWSQRFGGTSSDDGYAVAVDGSGNVLVTGRFSDTVNFGGGNLVSAGSFDIFVAKYNAAGVHQWSQRFGGTSTDYGYAVAVDGSGNVLVTGSFGGTVNFGGGNLVSTGSSDIFVAKYNAAGVHQWSQRFGGVSGDVGHAVAVDGSGDVLVTGSFNGTVNFGGGNLVSAGSSDIFVAKYATNPAEPVIASIVDIGNDQGGRVRIQFSRSGHDDSRAGTPIEQYEAFRRIDPLPSIASFAASTASAPGLTKSAATLPPGDWEFAGAIPAHAEEEYFMVAPTLADSTISAGQHYSVFFVRAATDAPSVFFDSPVDSGYSLDNLAPGVPTSFAFNAGNLTWDESMAADFDHFTVYGSNSSSFTTATLIDHTVSPGLDVGASPYTYYFVTATDFSGNEGNPAVSQRATGVEGTPRHYVLSVSAYPNPFNPRTTIRYTLPAAGRVRIAIYDARGAHIATLLDEEKNAGAFTIPWEGRSDGGEVASSGVYFARLEFGGQVRSYKTILLK